MALLIDLTGQRFGRLTVVALGERRRGPSGQLRVYWRVACDCGRERLVHGYLLSSGHTRSCGCLARELSAALNRKHGGKSGGVATPEYSVWRSMRRRCSNPHDASFASYGGRGIRVCDRWRDDFPAFLADMGPRPSARHQIDRIDVNGNYEPGNCRWATPREQQRNRRNNALITVGRHVEPAASWSEQVGVKAGTICARRRRGVDGPSALAPPRRAEDGFLEFRGERQSLDTWAKRIGLTRKAISGRLARGWTVEAALTTQRVRKHSRQPGARSAEATHSHAPRATQR